MIGIEGMVGISALLGGESSAQQVIMQIAGTTLRMEDVGAKPLLTRPRPFAISCYASPTFSDELAGVMWDSYVLDKN